MRKSVNIRIGNVVSQFTDSQAGDEAFATSLYDATDGDNWADRTGWETGEAVFEVGTILQSPVGLEITDVNGELRITAIDFQKITTVPASASGEQGDQHNGNNLTGEVETLSWDNLQKCTYINLKQNNLSGNLPSSVFLIEPLEKISFGGQRSDLDLADHQWNENNHQGQGFSKNWEETNAFTGTIPTTIGQAKNLVLFECRRQWLTGTIPAEIGGLDSIVGIFLNDQKGGNPLGGALPVEMGNLGNTLKHLHLDSRSNEQGGFSGDFPSAVNTGMAQLRHFRVRNNQFTGNIPDFPNCTDIRVYTANENNFSGDFPSALFDGSNPLLTAFLISYNNLSGDLPSSAGASYNSMSKFNIDGNGFTGSIPTWMQTMNGHQVFDCKENNLTGGFPEFILDRGDLKTFLISDNPLGGPLPSREWASDRMLTFYGQNCGFTGGIPSEWSTLTNSSNRMLYLYLFNNDLQGLIPSWMSQITGINRIYLENNRFTFQDILPNYSAINAAVGDYQVTPQKPFSNAEIIDFIPGDEVEINYGSFDYSGNTYQWYKDDQAITGETSFTLTLTNLQESDEGAYHLEINNSGLASLTCSSGITTLNFDDEQLG